MIGTSLEKHRLFHQLKLFGIVGHYDENGVFHPWGCSDEEKLLGYLAYDYANSGIGVSDNGVKRLFRLDESDEEASSYCKHLIHRINKRIRNIPTLPNIQRIHKRNGMSVSKWPVNSDVSLFKFALRLETVLEALSFYESPFLDGFENGDTPDFEAWLSLIRRELEINYLDALYEVIRRYVCQGYFQKAAEWLKVLSPESVSMNDGLVRKALMSHYKLGNHNQIELYYRNYLRCLEDYNRIITPSVQNLYEATLARDEETIQKAINFCCTHRYTYKTSRYGAP